MMRTDSPIRKPPYSRLGARVLAAVIILILTGCSRAAPPPAEAPPPAGKPAVSEPPSRSAPIETPRTVMKSLDNGQSSPRPPADQKADLFIPGGGEAPRFPRDYAIGSLGSGDGQKAPYREAIEVLSLAAAGKPFADRFLERGDRAASATASLVNALGPSLLVRAGSPLDQGDGGVSFLIRVLGNRSSLSGEMHLRPLKDGSWQVESITLNPDEEGSSEGEESDGASFDPLLYKRFL